MTEQAKREQTPQRVERDDVAAGKPSQAEGDRATVEQDLGERPRTSERPEPEPTGKPSQAEGDRATVEQNLRKQKRG